MRKVRYNQNLDDFKFTFLCGSACRLKFRQVLLNCIQTVNMLRIFFCIVNFAFIARLFSGNRLNKNSLYSDLEKWVEVQSLRSNLVAHQAGACPGFRSIKRLRVSLIPPGWDASPSQGYPSVKCAGTHLYTWVERGTVIKCLAQEHKAAASARARTRTARSGIQSTNH